MSRETIIRCDCCRAKIDQGERFCLLTNVTYRSYGGGFNPLSGIENTQDGVSVTIDWSEVCDPCQRAISQAVASTVEQLREPKPEAAK